MEMLLESATLGPIAGSPDVLAIDQQPTVFDRLTTVFHNTVDYVGDTLSTPARRLTAGLALAGGILAAMGAVAPAAEAKASGTLIEINEGIGAVHIGQTLKQVQKEAGSPTSKSARAMSWYYDYSAPFAQVSYGSNKLVDSVNPNSAKDKTSQGIGEGSSEEQVQAAYPNATCTPQPGPGATPNLDCAITKKLPAGKTIETSFDFGTANGSGGVNSIYITEF